MSRKWVLFLRRVFESTNSWKSKIANIFVFSSPESSLINCTLVDIYCSWRVVPHRFNTFEASNWSVRSSQCDDTYCTSRCRRRTCRSCTPSIAVRSSLSASSAHSHCEQNVNDVKGFLHSNSYRFPLTKQNTTSTWNTKFTNIQKLAWGEEEKNVDLDSHNHQCQNKSTSWICCDKFPSKRTNSITWISQKKSGATCRADSLTTASVAAMKSHMETEHGYEGKQPGQVKKPKGKG